METAEQKRTIWNGMFINLLITNCVMQMGQMMVQTIVPTYVKHLGAAAGVVGMVTSMFAFTALAVRPFASPAFDSFSKKKLLTIAMAVVTVSFVVYSQAKTIPMVIIARLLQGMGGGCAAPLALALASDNLPDDMLGRGISIFSLGQALAQAVGPSLGLRLSSTIGYEKTFLLSTVVLVASVLMMFLVKEQLHEAAEYRISLDRIVAKEAIRPAVLMLFLCMPYASISSFIAIYGRLWGVEDIGYYFTVYAIGLLITRPFSGMLTDRFGFEKVLIPGILFFGFSCVLISMSRSLSWFLVAAAMAAIGYGICQPTIQAMCMKVVPKERRGASGNTLYIGTDIGMMLGPAMAGKVVDFAVNASINEADSYSIMFITMLIPLAIALGYLLLNSEKFRKESQKMPVDI